MKKKASLILFTYNQEKYVKDAVNGVLSQRYSPLEIIISDDCSSDRTFDIVQKIAHNYDGIHTLIINKNKNNMGLIQHINFILEVANGEIIAMAAGDDISSPDRMTKTVAFFEKDDTCYGFFSNLIEINEKGNVTKEYRHIHHDLLRLENILKEGRPPIYAPSFAMRREVYDIFGPISYELYSEDYVFPFRAALLGKIRFCSENLVHYRRHNTNISRQKEIYTSKEAFYCNRSKLTKNYYNVYRNWMDDLTIAYERGTISLIQYDQYKKIISERINIYFLELKLYEKKSILNRAILLAKNYKFILNNRKLLSFLGLFIFSKIFLKYKKLL